MSQEPEVNTSTTPLHPSRTPFIAGNWKMNLDHLQAIAQVQKLAWSLKDVKHDYGSVEVAVFPPFTDLRSVQTLLSADKLAVRLGAQDVSPHLPGAYTGDIAAQFLAKLEARYVLVGHSERRQGHGENDALVAGKAVAAVQAGLVPVICVGETSEERAAGASTVPVAQLCAVLQELPLLPNMSLLTSRYGPSAVAPQRLQRRLKTSVRPCGRQFVSIEARRRPPPPACSMEVR